MTTHEDPLSLSIPDDWRQEFAAAARRPLATRVRYAFIHTYRPVLDDAPYRAFATLDEYLNVIYAPDGIEHFAVAWERHVDVQGFPVCHIDDIIASKEAANRVRDRESLPRLRAFRDWLRGQQSRGIDPHE